MPGFCFMSWRGRNRVSTSRQLMAPRQNRIADFNSGEPPVDQSLEQPRGRPAVPESLGDQRWRIGVMAGIPRRSSGMPTDSAAVWYQLLDSNVSCRLAVLRVVLLGFFGGAARLFQRSARSIRTATSPTNGARYCGAMNRSNQGSRVASRHLDTKAALWVDGMVGPRERG